MPLIIAVDIKDFKNTSTGVARYMRAILDCLQQIDTHNEYYLFECRPSSYHIANAKWKKILIPWRLPGVIWQQCILPFALKACRADVLWAPNQISPVLFMKNIRVIATAHDLSFIHVPESLQWSTTLIMKNLFPHVIKKSDVLFAISDFVKSDLLRTYPALCAPEKIITAYNGRPGWSLPATYRAASRQSFLFYAGNPEPRKNLIGVIKALEILHASGRRIDLHLAGPKGWKGDIVQRYIDNSPVKSQICRLGYLSEEDLRREYMTCAAFIYPSFYEGFGLPVLEALEMDCLVLTSKDTVMQEVAGKCAIYVDPARPSDMAEKIQSLYSPGFDRTEFLSARADVLAQYSWEKTARIILKALQDSHDPDVSPTAAE